MDVSSDAYDSPVAPPRNLVATRSPGSHQFLTASILSPFQLMDEDGWNRFTKDLDPEYPAVSVDFFEQVNQIIHCLKETSRMTVEECDTYDDGFEDYGEAMGDSPLLHSDDAEQDLGIDSRDYVAFRRIKRCHLDETQPPPRQIETDHYKFEDSSSGSDSGSSSPYDFGPCSSSSGSSSHHPYPRPTSLPLVRGGGFGGPASSSSARFCFDDLHKGRDSVPFNAESEANIPSPTPPAIESPSAHAAMLEQLELNESPMCAPIDMRGVRSPPTSMQTMTGSAGYSNAWNSDSASLNLSNDLPPSAGRRHGLHRPVVRPSASHVAVRPHMPPMPTVALHRHRSVHARKTPHYPPRPHPTAGHSDRVVDHRRAGLYHRPSSSTSARAIVSRTPTPTHQDSEIADGQAPRLWKFLYDLLEGDNPDPDLVVWTDRSTLTFRLVNSQKISQTWGQMKNKPNMCYESLGRSLRYYYAKNVLEKVETTRLSYRFKREHLRNNGIII